MTLNFHDKPIKSSKLKSAVTGKKTEGVVYKVPDLSHDGRWVLKFEDSAQYLSSAAKFVEQQRVDRVYAAVTGIQPVNQPQEMQEFLRLQQVVEQVRDKKPYEMFRTGFFSQKDSDPTVPNISVPETGPCTMATIPRT